MIKTSYSKEWGTLYAIFCEKNKFDSQFLALIIKTQTPSNMKISDVCTIVFPKQNATFAI